MADQRQGRGPGRVVHVTSLANPIVKEIRGLALPKNRRASRLFVAEGLKLVADAIDAGWRVRTLVHAARVRTRRWSSASARSPVPAAPTSYR